LFLRITATDGVVGKQRSYNLAFFQAKTALAETAGSRFFDDCTNLVSEGQVQPLMDRLVANIGLVYSKCTAKGENLTVESV
jgi:hypothetical protein